MGKLGYFDESSLGLYLLRVRYFDPGTGLFISRDPLGFAGGGANLYTYVGNNPVTGVDPSGLANSDEKIDCFERYRDALEEDCKGKGVACNFEQLEKLIKCIKEKMEPRQQAKALYDAIRNNEPVNALSKLKTDILGFTQGQINEFIDALKEFTPESNCRKWYKLS